MGTVVIPAWDEEVDHDVNEESIIGFPTVYELDSAAAARVVATPQSSGQVVNIIEPDDEDDEELSNNSLARIARTLRGVPRDGSKPREERVGRKPRSSTKKCSRRRGKSRGKSQGRSSLENLDTSQGGSTRRRSSRIKSRPLEYWKNESFIYGPHDEIGLLGEAMGDMSVVKGIRRASGTTYLDHHSRVVTPQRAPAASKAKKTKDRKTNIIESDYSTDEEDQVSNKRSSRKDSLHYAKIDHLTERLNQVTLSHSSRENELLQHIKTLEDDNGRLLDQNESLTNQLKCPVCHEVKADDMYRMECGHRTCSDCSLRLEKCHTCRATLKKGRGWLKRIY